MEKQNINCKPEISVIITTYNAESVICDTINSILKQSFRNFELIIVDDGSSDNTVKRIKSIEDHRISLYQNINNRGMVAVLNEAMQYARGKYIARSDKDDISYPLRLQKQKEYMDSHPEIFLCGCNYDLFYSETDRRNHDNKYITEPNEIKFSLLFGNFVIPHSSFFFRNEEAHEKGIIYRKYKYAVDYDLLLQAALCANIGYIDEVLVGYRIHEGQITNTIGHRNEIIHEKAKMIGEFVYHCNMSEHCCDIAVRAITNDLMKYDDFSSFEILFCLYAKQVNMSENDKHEFECMKYIFHHCILSQRYRNMDSLKVYMCSQFRSVRRILSKSGIHYIMDCIFGINRY